MTANPVYILATIRKPELAVYTELVFRTLRTGFPNAQVEVHINGECSSYNRITDAAQNCGCAIKSIPDTKHHEWIEKLCREQTEPFWVCDCDLIFFRSMEDLSSNTSLYGWRIPQWEDEFTKCTTMARIHPCLMLINPGVLNEKLEAYRKSFNLMGDINPLPNLFAPTTVPLNGGTRFYDVCGLLYHAVGGVGFQDAIKDRFCHLNFGTISDRVLPRLKNGEAIMRAREAVLENPELGRGGWMAQEQYYADRQVVHDGHRIDDALSDEDIKLAREWNVALCCGDTNAMAFCDLWHRYCHAIDDLIDTMEDGRPIMSKDQTIGIFLQAAVIYNCAFFVAYRNLLFPIVLDITNVYMMSVQWERAPQAHLRKMGDVFRTCGNRMYAMVALICGGEEHMRVISRKITERDYLSQHDSNDQPI